MNDASPLHPLPAPRMTPYGLVRAAPFTGDPAIPSQSEVVVIGGGVCGVMTAWFLAKRGIPVTVCEKAEIGCEASSRAFGWVSELLVDPVKVPMARIAKSLWQQVHTDAGETGLRQNGLTYLADSPAELEFYAGWLQQTAAEGDPGNCILTGKQIAERYPSARRSFVGGIFSPSDGSVEPVLAAPAVATAARRAGARIVTHCAVRGLDIQAGRVAGVFTEKGHIRANQVLCAANAWSRLFCGNHGIDVPQIYAIMTQGRTGVCAGPTGNGGQQAWAWRRQIDGAFSLGRVAGVRVPVTRDTLRLRRHFLPLLKQQLGGGAPTFGVDALADLRLSRHWRPDGPSPFERHRMLSGQANTAVTRESFKLNRAVFEEFGATSVAETWAGALTLTPDGMPIAGACDAIPGFYLLTGCSFGLTWSPALGQMMADVMMQQQPALDPRPFRLSRFFDGSELRLTH